MTELQVMHGVQLVPEEALGRIVSKCSMQKDVGDEGMSLHVHGCLQTDCKPASIKSTDQLRVSEIFWWYRARHRLTNI